MAACCAGPVTESGMAALRAAVEDGCGADAAADAEPGESVGLREGAEHDEVRVLAEQRDAVDGVIVGDELG